MVFCVIAELTLKVTLCFNAVSRGRGGASGLEMSYCNNSKSTVLGTQSNPEKLHRNYPVKIRSLINDFQYSYPMHLLS